MQGVVFFLARLSPEHMPEVAHDLRDDLRSMLRRQKLARTKPPTRLFLCLGRHEALLVAPVAKFAPMWRPVALRGLKKLDIQLCYESELPCEKLFEKADGDVRNEALAFLAYARVHEQITLRYGEDGHRAIGEALAARLGSSEDCVKPYLFRSCGWPDFVVLALSDNVEHLTKLAREGIWPLALRDVGSDPIRSAIEARELDGRAPALCRTYSVLAYHPAMDEDGQWHTVEGRMVAPRADLRIRNGAEFQAQKAAERALRVRRGRTEYCSELGHEDASVGFVGGGKRPLKLKAANFLKQYNVDFLPQARDHIYSAELRILTDPVGEEDTIPWVHQPPPAIEPPRQFLGVVEEQPGGAPLGCSLRNLCSTINWAMNNDGLYPIFADLYLHAAALCRGLDRRAQLGRALERGVLPSLSLECDRFATALSQRLSGSYYGLTSYQPEHLLEYSGGIHKVLSALWGLQSAFLEASGAGEDTPGYFVVTKGEPAWVVPRRTGFVTMMPASAALTLEHGVAPVAHELGHVLLYWMDPQEEALERALRGPGLPGKLGRWHDNAWRASTLYLLREVFADLVCLFGFLEGEPGPILARFTEVLPWVMADAGSLMMLHIRLWVLWSWSRTVHDAGGIESLARDAAEAKRPRFAALGGPCPDDMPKRWKRLQDWLISNGWERLARHVMRSQELAEDIDWLRRSMCNAYDTMAYLVLDRIPRMRTHEDFAIIRATARRLLRPRLPMSARVGVLQTWWDLAMKRVGARLRDLEAGNGAVTSSAGAYDDQREA